MTEKEWLEFRQELRQECNESTFDILTKELLEDVQRRDAELAKLIVHARDAEIAIGAYLREKDGN